MSKVSISSQSRTFHLVLYPDSDTYDTTHILSDSVVNLKWCSKWAYALHDRDLDDRGLPKKSHIHLVLSAKYPVKYSDVLTKLGLPDSSIYLPEKSKTGVTYRTMVRYLIHADVSKKYQYDMSCIESNFDISEYFDLASQDRASSAFLDLLEFILDKHKSNSRRSVAVYAAQNGLLGYYRQYYTILWDIFYSEKKNAYTRGTHLLEELDKMFDNQ